MDGGGIYPICKADLTRPDLHSNNNVISLQDETGKVIYERRLSNDLDCVLGEITPYGASLEDIAIESTYNWYWLVDGLMDAGYRMHLTNTAAIKQYEGLKHTDDPYDARWLANLLRLGILPEGYIYPKEERPVRDLLRKRSQMVRQRTTNILSIQNLVVRNTGKTPKCNQVKRFSEEEVDRLLPDPYLSLAVKSNLAVLRSLDGQIERLEKAALSRAKLRREFKLLLSVPGIGKILGLTIMLETGDIGRFPKAGNFSSYCRCVSSGRFSNGKKKGQGNTKNGNKYLSWAFVEAGNFAARYNPLIKRFYQRKRDKTNTTVATKAVAHKLARACYHILRDRVPFNPEKSFG